MSELEATVRSLKEINEQQMTRETQHVSDDAVVRGELVDRYEKLVERINAELRDVKTGQERCMADIVKLIAEQRTSWLQEQQDLIKELEIRHV